MLQNPQQGGTFEYHPNTRSESDAWAFDEVARILKGNMEGVDAATEARAGQLFRSCGVRATWCAELTARMVCAGAGSLIIFAGKLSLHRVSPVRGRMPLRASPDA